MDTLLLVLNGIALVGLTVSHILLRNSLTAYASEKGKNLATKEDVAEITALVESAKVAIQQQDRFAAKKYELKYAACQNLLRIVDAQLSYVIKQDNAGNPTEVDRQFATAEEIRRCHNEIILSIDNREIIKIFLDILTGLSSNSIVDLDMLRGLIRTELGFVGEAHSDAVATWIGKSVIANAA